MYNTYLSLINHIIIDSGINFKTIELFEGQYDENYNDVKANGFPACYVQFLPMRWEEGGDGSEHSDVTIILHLVTWRLNNNPNELFNLSKELGDHMRGKGKDTLPHPLIAPLRKVSTDFVPQSKLSVFKLGFKTVIYDKIPDQYTHGVNGEYDFIPE